ncbi:MAG: hypothetical protein ACI9FN_003731 [Saprospiraceae bacterium]|jgi:hypothetical protein
MLLDSTYTKLHRTRIVNADEEVIRRVKINNQYVSALITGNDTIIIAEIENINISSPRSFKDRNEYFRYMKYRRYAAKVYPFAKEAIRIFREAEYATSHMKKRKQKRHLKKLSKDLQKDFSEPLQQLSKTQGKIMVKMIERELGTSMHKLIKMTQGKLKAFYWDQSSKLYGYRLKTGYIVGENPILDVVLQDFDISYEVNVTSLN